MTTDKQEAVQIAVELYQTWQANASRHGGNIHLLMQRVWDAWQPAAMTPDKPRHDGEWVSVPRTYLRLVHDTLQDIDAYIIVPTFARDDWETAKEQTAALAASPATSALGTEDGEPLSDEQVEGAMFVYIANLNPRTRDLEATQSQLAAMRLAIQSVIASQAQTVEALWTAASTTEATLDGLNLDHGHPLHRVVEDLIGILRRALKEHTNG